MSITEHVCRVAGHNLRQTFRAGVEVKHYCLRCGGEWPTPSRKETLHRERTFQALDCVTLADCTVDNHTNVWPCDFA